MSLTATTIATAITSTQTQFKVTAVTGFAAGKLLRVNDEFMLVKEVDTTTYWITVYERGYNGTVARAHGILSLAVVGSFEDFEVQLPPHQYSYGADGAITVGQGLHKIVKGSAIALTLRAPHAEEEGLTLTIVAATAYLHSIRLDSGYFNALTDNQILFTGVIGDHVKLMAIGGSWMIVSAGQATYFNLPSRSPSVSTSISPSKSASVSTSASPSVSPSVSTSASPSVSTSKSPSVSPSAST